MPAYSTIKVLLAAACCAATMFVRQPDGRWLIFDPAE